MIVSQLPWLFLPWTDWGGGRKYTSELSKRCSFWGWGRKERAGWVIFLRNRVHRWQRFVIFVFSIKHFDLAATKKRVFSRKKGQRVQSSLQQLKLHMRTGLGSPSGKEGQLRVGSSGSPKTQELRSDPKHFTSGSQADNGPNLVGFGSCDQITVCLPELTCLSLFGSL